VAKRWRPIGGAGWVAVANFLVGTGVAAVAAAGSLLIEDALPIEGSRDLSWERVAALVAALGLLFGAVRWRGRVHRRTGTLFYVRVIDDAMEDWHRLALQAAARRRLSLQSVTRWIDLPARTSQPGPIDVVGVCEQVAAAMQALVDTDRDDTGYTLAPNMLWPVALAVGAELPIVERLDLLELDTASRGHETRFALPSLPAGRPGRLTVEHEDYEGAPTGRVGLLLAFGKAAVHMDPRRVFADMGISEHYLIRPAWVGADLASLRPGAFDQDQLAALAAGLPVAVAEIKDCAGSRECVVAAAMPKTLAVALGWGLAQATCRFFTGTHLLHYDGPTGRYMPMRVHPSQPTGSPDAGVG
jgi:hypothetical protein